MIKRHDFPIPEGVIEVTDEYQLNLAHYELLHLKPRGTIQFAGETKVLNFQFFATEDRNEGLFARFDEPMNSGTKRICDYLEKYPRTEGYINITLLQFKMIFIVSRVDFVQGVKQRTLKITFPTKFLKTHRRRFIRIPFNDSFPAELSFQGEGGPMVRKVRDLSREGLRIRLEPDDVGVIKPGVRLKQASLKILGREITLGLTVVALYPVNQAGLRILAMSEENKVWLKDFIRVLMKQILNLPDPPFDDEIKGNPEGAE
jgi:hypothetical protein